MKRIILCDGDTFPDHGVYEGEVTNDEIAENMPDFTPIKLWTSEVTFNPSSISNSISNGAGYLSVHFFKAYNNSETLAKMLVKSQNDYLNYVWKDPFTLEEFILLGDPSLKVGGYNEK